MSINVSVPLEALENPDVARALSALMLSLGGVAAAPAAAPRLAAARPSAVPVAAPEPVAAAPVRVARRAPRTRAAPAPSARDEGQRYHDFVDNLPDPSRKFLDLIRKHGSLRLSQAVRELGITRPKTLGGITGSLTRWARQRDVELPYKAGKSSDGERVWTWTRGVAAGGNSDSATAKRTRSRRRGASAARGGSDTKKKKGKESEPTPAAVVASKPDVTGNAILEDERYAPLLDGMNDTARRFLVVLSEQRSLTMTEALEALERKRAKTVGDAVRSFLFRARDANLKLPFEERASHSGERMWLWTGLLAEEFVRDENQAERPSVIVIRGGRNARSA